MAELPDDVIEAFAGFWFERGYEARWDLADETVQRDWIDRARVLLRFVQPLIAARVRAEARPASGGDDALIEAALDTVSWELIGALGDPAARSGPREAAAHVARSVADAVRAEAVADCLTAVRSMPRRRGQAEWSKGSAVAQAVGYDMGLAAAQDAVKSVEPAAVDRRAEAVADERQRLAAIRVLAQAAKVAVPHAPYTGVSWQRLFEILDGSAAGSVPEATPETCGWWDGPEGHVYGICNQPKGHQGRHAETLADGTHWAGWGGGSRPPAPATRGTATDPWSVSGPVATPTEPPYVDLLAILHQDDCEHGNMPEVCARCDGASPVPAEPARERLSGWFDVTEVPAEQPEGQ